MARILVSATLDTDGWKGKAGHVCYRDVPETKTKEQIEAIKADVYRGSCAYDVHLPDVGFADPFICLESRSEYRLNVPRKPFNSTLSIVIVSL